MYLYNSRTSAKLGRAELKHTHSNINHFIPVIESLRHTNLKLGSFSGRSVSTSVFNCAQAHRLGIVIIDDRHNTDDTRNGTSSFTNRSVFSVFHSLAKLQNMHKTVIQTSNRKYSRQRNGVKNGELCNGALPSVASLLHRASRSDA